MFSEQTQRFFRYARIEVVDIPDPTGNGMTEKTFVGPIQRQLRDALAYLRNYVLQEAVLKDGRKAEATRIWNYPYAAIEEILSNAVYHRSYQIPEPITVRITPTCIEITSFPGFDRSISDEAIQRQEIRARSYRNRRIGDFLKELHLIEGRNTGFPNAKRHLRITDLGLCNSIWIRTAATWPSRFRFMSILRQTQRKKSRSNMSKESCPACNTRNWI